MISTKTFRVFVSSTFTDMREERSILQRDVFPRLKKFCESKDASFQDVDLRWGVNEDAQLDHKIMNICLGEITRCQQLSPKPNFIVLMGDKYGWQPLPEKIPSSEMEMILKILTGDDNNFLTSWYHEDLNAIPPEYVLQPRGEHLRKYEDWQKIERSLQSILRTSVNRLNFSDDLRIKYFASATHQEIIKGALNTPPDDMDPDSHVFAYFRNIKGLPDDETARDYINIINGVRDQYAKKQLYELKGALTKKLPKDHIYLYETTWANGCTIDNVIAFGDRVYEDLKSVIERQMEGLEDLDALTFEKNLHDKFKGNRLENFRGRKDALDAIAEYLRGTSSKVFSIIGASGSGKTSLLAKALDEIKNRKGVTIFRFLGTTTATSDIYQLLTGLIDEFVSEYKIEKNTLLKEGEDEKIISTLYGLREIFTRCFSLATQEKPILIVLDALDQLSRDINTILLDWIPKELPEHVKFIVSALPDLKEKLAKTLIYDLIPMPAKEGKELLDTWLTEKNRTLTPEQKNLVISNFSKNGIPLYLKLAFEKAKAWHSYDKNLSLEPDIDGILEEYFETLKRDHSSLLVSKVCGYILSGKYQGLTENEVLDLLVYDKEYWDYFLEVYCHPDYRNEVEELNRLPIVIWSRLFLDLEPYLTTRNADGIAIITFFHSQFIKIVKLLFRNESLSYNRMLANYFNKHAYFFKKKKVEYNYSISTSTSTINIRKVSELSWQLITIAQLTGEWAEVENLFSDFFFFEAKVMANMVYSLAAEFKLILKNIPPETPQADFLSLLNNILDKNIYFISRHNSYYPQALFQCVWNNCFRSSLSLAKKSMQSSEDNKTYLENYGSFVFKLKA